MKTNIQCILFISCLLAACATQPVRPPPDPDQPAKLGTSLKLLSSAMLDIGKDEIIHPHLIGIQAQDPEGNIWVSRRMPGRNENAFYPQVARPADISP